MATTDTTSFDISSKTPSTEESIQIKFNTPSTLTSVQYTNSIISGSIESDSNSTPNVTILKNNFPINSFIATRFYIVGNANQKKDTNLTSFVTKDGDIYKPYLVDPTQVNYGELIIEGTDSIKSKKVRICFLLLSAANAVQGAGSLVELLQSNSTNPSKIVDFGSAISGAFAQAKSENAKPKDTQIREIKLFYVKYELDAYTYIASTTPIYVNATLIFGNSFDLSSKGINDYVIINAFDNEQWMECDYAPLSSSEITVMQVPIGSVSDLDSEQSFKQIVLFLVFLIFILVFYFVIPPMYQMLLLKLANNDQNALCKTMEYFDYGYNIIFMLLWIILISVGVSSTEENAPNVLYAGVVIVVMHIITFGTIMVSKYNPNFPFEGRQQRCAVGSASNTPSNVRR